ncbi:hypothetical protein [Shewanella sp. OMA3-2]|uniref:hypothetical protein n=1 Tax=Shewanella sp. OMA3-2 TaxID=2908650 RepID=UPI001F2CBC82|nr:hypothetical protein [Shewanella sp. OMA3-2]UJF23217.1 hypothetical protein L0B17_07775 [Shewanella sp. OMA3-2]
MKKPNKKVVSTITLLVGLAGYWYFTSEPATLPDQASITPQKEPSITQPSTQTVQTKPRIKDQVETIPESISESFSLLADAYASELTLPAYSMPLTAEDTHLLNPNNYLPQSVMLQDGGSASIVLPQYRFSYPEPVIVKLVVNGMAVTSVNVSLKSEQNQSNDILGKEDMLSSKGEWTARLDAKEEWDGPIEVRVTFSAKGKKQTISTGIEYSYPAATITGVGNVRAEGSDMVIPVKLAVEKAGYYRLRANLHQQNGQPIALLTGSEKLSQGEAEIELKAYKAVLAQHSGPFKIATFVLELRPGVPGELTRYGHSEQASFDLGDFAVEQLSDEQWQPDEQELQRLEFLQKMARD